jgi:hypothetical protein
MRADQEYNSNCRSNSKYRIVKHKFWHTPQVKGWFFWQDVVIRDSSKWERNDRFEYIGQAKQAIEDAIEQNERTVKHESIIEEEYIPLSERKSVNKEEKEDINCY